jgi:hypothetical protein
MTSPSLLHVVRPWPFYSTDERCAPAPTTQPANERRECNACDWTGSRAECVWLAGMDGGVGPLCPECRETTEVA